MKKKLMILLACVMCLAVSLGVIACSNGDDPKTPSEKTYAVTYDPGYTGAQTFSGDDVKVGEKFTLAAAPTRGGYDFLGWNDGKSTYAAGSEYTLTEEKDVTFTGQWQPHVEEPETITATFLDADGEFFSSEEVEIGGNATGPGNVLVHEYDWCYEHTGWDKPLTGLIQDTTFNPVFTYHPTELEAYSYEDNEDKSGYVLSLEDWFDATEINDGKIAFPAEYNGKPVTELNDANLTADTVYVPGSIKKVNEYAFKDSQIRELIFGEGVEEIAEMAIYNVGIDTEVEVKWSAWPLYFNILDKISFPSTLKKIGSVINPYITVIEIAEGANLTMNNGLLMTDNNTNIISVPYTGEDIDLVIPATVSEISDSLCDERNDIVSLRISGKLTHIGDQAFNYCYRLNDITFDDGAYVEEIGIQAFYQCGLKYGTTIDASWTKPLVFPAGLKKIGIGALWTDLCELSIPNTVEEIGEGAIVNSMYCELKLSMTGGTTTKNGKYTIENNIVIEHDSQLGDKIMIYANGNTATTYITPASVKRFDCFAFAYQTHLEELTVSEGVKVIPQSFASGGTGYDGAIEMSLKKVTLPASLEKIEGQFHEIESDIFIGAHGFGGIIMMGQYGAFIAQGNLTQLIIDENAKITYLPSMLALNSGVISFRIPKNVESIGSGLFGRAFQKYEIADGNTHFAVDNDGVLFNADMTEILAFPQGYTKTTWTAPATLKKVRNDGMYYIKNLEEIDFSQSQLEEVGAYAFEQNYYVEYDSNWRPIPGTEKGLKKVTFPATLKKVGDGLFTGDALLEEVIFLGENPPEFLLNAGYTSPEIFPNNLNLEIKVPENSKNAYYAALSAIDPNYALHIKGTQELTFKFDLGGGKYNGTDKIDDISDYFLNEYPIPTKDGSFFQGWYTKNGDNGDWGDIALPPYAPITENSESTVTLYAKWGNERWETGAWYAPYAYEEGKTYTGYLCGRHPNFVQDENSLPILWIEYTPTEDMTLGWDEGNYYLSYKTGEENNFQGSAVFASTRFENWNTSNVTELKANTTYYIAIILCDSMGDYLGGTECTVSDLQFLQY